MRRVFLTALVIPLILSCAGTETPDTVNQAPEINWTYTPIAVSFLSNPILTVSVTDPDGDPLTVTWEVTGSGTLESQNSSNTAMLWRIGASERNVGENTVTVRVSDGELSDSVTEVVKRATLNDQPTYSNGYRFEKAKSPYILDPPTPKVNIGEPGRYEPVIIEGGVQIFLDARSQGEDGLEIEVLSELQAHGTLADTVLILPNDRTLQCNNGVSAGWWKGIRLVADERSAGRVDFSYTGVGFGRQNIYLHQGAASANLNNCLLVGSSFAGIFMESNGTLVVNESAITCNARNGIEISPSGLPSEVTITDNRIDFNLFDGIRLDFVDSLQTGNISIRGNYIGFNGEYGIGLFQAVWPTIRRNDFELNGGLSINDIWLDGDFPTSAFMPADWDSLFATNNYWGQSYDQNQQHLIQRKIHDKTDDSAIGTYVVVDPWQNTPNHTP